MKLIIVVMYLISLLLPNNGSSLYPNRPNTDINDLCDVIIDAISTQNATALEELFSKEVRENVGTLHEDAKTLFHFIKGNILSVSDPNEHGVDASSESNNGKIKRELQPTLCIETTDATYFIAFKVCVRDGFNPNNVGVTSLRIVDATEWPIMFVYRGGGQWPLGISIDDGASTEAFFYREGYWDPYSN